MIASDALNRDGRKNHDACGKRLQSERVFCVSGERRLQSERVFCVSCGKSLQGERVFCVSRGKRLQNEKMFYFSDGRQHYAGNEECKKQLCTYSDSFSFSLLPYLSVK